MNKLIEQLDELDDAWMNDYHTPQTLAWKLLMSDDIKNLSSAIMSFNADGYDEAEDPNSFTFEIMITIFVEMLCSLATIMSEDDAEVRKRLNMSDFFDTVTEKLLKASVSVNINVIEKEWLENDSGYFKQLLDKRYCKVILRDNPEEEPLFRAYNVDDENMYHMLLNPKYKKQKKLRDIEALFSVKENIYQVSFDFFKHQEIIRDVPNGY
jgi:hypothetical protein